MQSEVKIIHIIVQNNTYYSARSRWTKQRREETLIRRYFQYKLFSTSKTFAILQLRSIQTKKAPVIINYTKRTMTWAVILFFYLFKLAELRR